MKYPDKNINYFTEMITKSRMNYDYMIDKAPPTIYSILTSIFATEYLTWRTIQQTIKRELN